MKLSRVKIEKAIDNAVKVLSSVYNKFDAPYINSITITNASSYWANIRRVKSHGDVSFSIRVSKTIELIPNEELAQRRLEETIIHELIHTIPGCMNHGSYFKHFCSLVNNNYPNRYVIKTRTNSEDYGVAIENKPKFKYEIVCTHCGKKYYYARKPKYDIRNYTCGKCHKDGLIIRSI